MKRFIECGLVVSVITLAFCASAIASSSPKIGCFDMQAVIANSQAGKQLLIKLRQEEQTLRNTLEEKGRAFVAAKDQYEKSRDLMSEKARSRKEQELAKMYAQVQQLRVESQDKLTKERNAGMIPIIKKIEQIAARIGKEDRYDFIIEKAAIHYVGNPKTDLTTRITRELDSSQ